MYFPKKLSITLSMLPIEIHVYMYYNNTRKAEEKPLTEGSEDMDLNTTEALLKAIIELIEKCDTLEELRESVKRIMDN